MIEQIKYYREVLDELTEKLYPNNESLIRLKWTTGPAEQFENQRISHEYADQVYFYVLEARMQLGNLLKYVSDKENPYRKAALKRLNGESDEIADPIDRNKNFELPEFDTKVNTLDYIRELLQEMQDRLIKISKKYDDLHDNRVDIHISQSISNLSLAKNYCGKILECIKNIRDIKNG